MRLLVARQEHAKREPCLFGRAAYERRKVETFLVASWVEHLRQYERVTLMDRMAEARARVFHRGDVPLVTAHLIAEPRPSKQA